MDTTKQAGHQTDYDLAVIGGGSAGYAAARSASRQGLKTALIDGARELGGLCILRGCMPTKGLLHVAEEAHRIRHAQVYGLQAGPLTVDFPAVMARKQRLIQDFAGYRQEQLQNGSFQLIRAHAQFSDPHTLELDNGQRITARHFIIASGSVVAPSPLHQLDQAGYLTSDDALELTALPESLIVLGGGAVAVEFAQFFRRMGIPVSMVQRSETILREFDDDIVAVIEHVLQREGIPLYTGTRLQDAWAGPNEKGVAFFHHDQPVQLHAAEILYALGRIPNTARLALDKAGVETCSGRILTDDYLRTSAPHIYAAGDCRGEHEIVHLAIEQAEIAAHNIAQPDNPKRRDNRLLVMVIFTDPQVAFVGLTEKAAQAQGIPYRTASYPFDDHGKSLIMEARDGFVKLLTNPDTGEIIGGAAVGILAGELIHEIVAAMYKRMTAAELASMPHYHPTLAEIWTYPAEELAQ